MSRDVAVAQVLEGLQALIMMGARSAASEQYAPSIDVDASEERIEDGKRAMATFRRLRQEFEDVVTGVL